MLNFFTLILLIGQGCNNAEISSETKQVAAIDSLNKTEQVDTVFQVKNEAKINTDTINDYWYIVQRLSDVSFSDTIFNPSAHLVIENNLITKLVDGKVMLVDSIFNTENTNSFKKYQLQKREKDFFKYSKKYDTIRLFIGGEDGIREIYKRKRK